MLPLKPPESVNCMFLAVRKRDTGVMVICNLWFGVLFFYFPLDSPFHVSQVMLRNFLSSVFLFASCSFLFIAAKPLRLDVNLLIHMANRLAGVCLPQFYGCKGIAC